jgi:hypothetical protein
MRSMMRAISRYSTRTRPNPYSVWGKGGIPPAVSAQGENRAAISHPPLPPPKAALAEPTAEGIDGGWREQPFPEAAARPLRLCCPTPGAARLFHGCDLPGGRLPANQPDYRL